MWQRLPRGAIRGLRSNYVLKSRGVEFVQEPTKADWGMSAIFKDVDGKVFVLSTP